MWTPDEKLLRETIDTLGEMVAAATDDDRPTDERSSSALSALECLGTLAFLDRGFEGDAILAQGGERFRSVAGGTLGGLDGEDIDDALSEVLRSLADLPFADANERLVVEEKLVGAMKVRDVTELVLEGARRTLGREVDIPVELEAAVLAFDEAVDERLWRILPMGTRRTARVVWAAPQHRSRLWWWERGSDLPASALDDLGTAARVIHLFPDAREELERLIRAEATIGRI